MQRTLLCVRGDGICRRSLLSMALFCLLIPQAGAQQRPAQQKSAPPSGERKIVPAPPAVPSKVQSSGTFTDRSGTAHKWQINASHALIWDGVPFLPVGGTFTPRSFASNSEAAWQEDLKALETLKAHGVLDLIVAPGKPLADVPIPAFQRLIDALESNGFRYGLAFGPGVTAPLVGTVVKPSSYRFADTRDALTATWQAPATDTAFYVLVDAGNENKILRPGIAVARDNVVSVPVEAPQAVGNVVALLFPHKSLAADADGTLPNLWDNFDAYRDNTLGALSQVKFGKGFRFFLDPLARRLGLMGETDFLVPDSTGFRLEWEGYLARKYPTLEEAKQAWGLLDGDFKTHRDLACLIPLWANANGVPYFRDMTTGQIIRIADTRQSRWWQDFLECRNDGVLYYMNAMADLLKHQVADVPVVYTWTQTHPIFWNTDRDGGYDGLSVEVSGQSRIARILGPAYSEAEQASRTIWCLATEVTNENAAPHAASAPRTASLQANGPDAAPGPYPSQQALSSDLGLLYTVGFKGFFVGALQAAPDTHSAAADWSRSPNSLDWLHDYAAQVDGQARSADYAPRILFYPQNTPGPARVGLVPGTRDVLWLNSFYDGIWLDWWPSYNGYTIPKQGPLNWDTLLVSLRGPKVTHFHVETQGPGTLPLLGNEAIIQAFTPDDVPVPIKRTGKSSFQITLDSTPTLFVTGGQRLVPEEAAETAAAQAETLYKMAVMQHIPSIDQYRADVERAVDAYRHKDFETAFVVARPTLDNLADLASPYIWIEGENPRVHTFSEIAPNREASGGAYLRLSTPNPPNHLGYGARYLFSVPTKGRYTVWLAGTLPGPNTSPIKWRVNSDPVQDPEGVVPADQPLYLGERFGWVRLGTVELQPGEGQSLTVYVTDRALSPPDYIFSIDALLLAGGPFKPNGTVRPLPVENAVLSPAPRAKSR